MNLNYLFKYATMNTHKTLLAAVMAIGCTWLSATAQNRITQDDIPASWQYVGEFDQTIPTDDTWWKKFGDPMLDSLITIGVDNNYDVLTAMRRIEIARQGLRQIKAGYYPTVGVNGGFTASRNSGEMGAQSVPASTSRYFDLEATINWEIDIFGKVASKAKQGRAQVSATKAEYSGMMVAVSAKIASAYLRLRTLQAEMAMLKQHIELQESVTKITQARHEAGLASMLDVSQSLTTFYSTTAATASLSNNIQSAINTLAVLTGMFPEQMEQYVAKEAPMPDYHQMVAVGVPAELLRRRPDVVQAEYTLAGYAAAIGVAKKDFLPTLSLSGSIGTAARDVSDLFSDRSFTYSVAPTLSWTIFDGMARSASLESARQQMQIGIDSYNSTILTAVQEVDNAMSAYHHNLIYIDMLEKVVEQAHKAYDLSIDLYKQGLTPFINVTNSQISYLTYSNELLEAKGQTLASLVNLYEALGGGY